MFELASQFKHDVQPGFFTRIVARGRQRLRMGGERSGSGHCNAFAVQEGGYGNQRQADQCRGVGAGDLFAEADAE